MIRAMNVRVCPDCGEEFRPEIVRCSDCGALLQDRLEGDVTGAGGNAASGSESATPEPPAVVEIRRRSLYASNRISEIQPLAERLGTAGMQFWVEPAGDTWTVLVAEADEGPGRAIVTELFGISDHATAAFDPEAGYSECPACGHALQPAVVECPECGLSVGAVPADGDE
jgi:ribosomal protein L32